MIRRKARQHNTTEHKHVHNTLAKQEFEERQKEKVYSTHTHTHIYIYMYMYKSTLNAKNWEWWVTQM